jgi:two-component system, LuxR family, response regulator FixJ
MSNSARKRSNSSEPQRLTFEHVDRRGRVSLLPLSSETQRLFSAANLGPRSTPHADPAGERTVRGDIRAAARSLTVRQWQVFDLLIAGLSSKQIGHELSISPRTVEIHRAQLMQKMGVRNTASLVRVALLAA